MINKKITGHFEHLTDLFNDAEGSEHYSCEK